MKLYILAILFFVIPALHAQAEAYVFPLDALHTLLTNDVKAIIDKNINDKQTVFLGEAVHYSGSDFLAKAEFVKYLVSEHGYRDIAFESDFFALLFNHDKKNLYKMWGASDQCRDLMDFLKMNHVTIWGFDNRMPTAFSQMEFTGRLSDFLRTVNLPVNEKFTELSKLLIKNEYASRGLLSKEDIEFLNKFTEGLLTSEKVKADILWSQILMSFKSTIELYTVRDDADDTRRITIRDKQMALNLNFLVKQHPDKKFIVWSANGHMSKCDYKYMKGMTMGAQFQDMNPKTSYHIAFASIMMPPEKSEKAVLKAAKNKDNILSIIPSVKSNYFLDASHLVADYPSLGARQYEGARLFNFKKDKIEILNHYDALVFIAGGIEVSYTK